MKTRQRNLLAASSCLIGLAMSVTAADLHKADNTNALNSATAWTENVVPGGSDNLIWDSTVTGAGTFSFGNGQFTGGVTIQNPGGKVSLRVASSGTTTWANSALIDMSSSTVDVDWTGGTLRVASGSYSPTLTVASGRTLTIGGNGITNQGNTKTLTMAGTGNIIINANAGSGGAMSLNINGANVTMNNAASGWSSVTVSSGKLILGNSTVMSGKRLTLSATNGLGFAAGITSATLGGLEGSGSFALTNADTNPVALTIGTNNTSYTLSGDISGAGSLIKSGSGTQTLSGNNSFAGGISLESGAITFGHSNAAAGGTITAAGNTGVSLANSSSVFLGGTLAVSGANANVTLSSGNITAGFNTAFTGSSDQKLTISGSNQVNMSSGSQQFSGFEGTVAVEAGATLRFSNSSLNNGGTNTTFDLTGNLNTRNNGSLALGALTGTGNISMGGSGGNNAKLNLTVGAKNLSTTYDGIINDADAANGKTVNLTKTGTGTLTLTGNQNYTGTTTVSAGTLLITGALGATNVTVEVDGTIGGSGNLGGDLTFDAGGSLDLTGATLGLTSTGILTVASGKVITLNNFSFADIIGWNAAAAADGIYTLINGGLDVVLGGSTPTISSPFALTGSKYGYFQEGSLQAVIYTIPEPAAALLGGLGMLALLRRRRH